MTRRKGAGAAAAALLFMLLAGTGKAGGADGHGHHAPKGAVEGAPGGPGRGMAGDETAQRRYFTDLKVLDQEGRTLRFYSDVLKDRVVVVSFIYTSCTDVCPILMGTLFELQSLLGDRMGREVHFVSISVDPEDDSPEALKAYGERYRAGPGWTFLTGKKENVDWITYKLGQYTPDFEDHTMLFLLGDVRRSRWAKVRGDLPAALIAEKLAFILGPGPSSGSAPAE